VFLLILKLKKKAPAMLPPHQSEQTLILTREQTTGGT
ncbi:hypothetical protein A2U01_0084567, partial [Trifolium medium]|nr:hypothetical protein [Trifolium medium]